MRNLSFSAATWSSHIDTLVMSELEKTSQGAPSRPSTSQLKLIPLALTFMVFSRCPLFPKIVQERRKGFRRRRRHEVSGVDRLEACAWDLLGDPFGHGDGADEILAPGDDERRTSDLGKNLRHVGARHHAKGERESDRIVGEVAPAIIL